jgi:PTH2 family peptidyl-tRNA hydrolase
MSRISKQVIVMRKSFIVDGKKVTPRKGKYIAQGSHSSLGAILNQMSSLPDYKYASSTGRAGKITKTLEINAGSALHDWIEGSFTKVTLCVETEEELLAVYNKAKEAGLITCLITDSGRTEFGGVPTITCCSILGWSDEIDPITGHLELF